jgi:hypothetical protein
MTSKINLKETLSNQDFECYSQFLLLKGTTEKEN